MRRSNSRLLRRRRRVPARCSAVQVHGRWGDRSIRHPRAGVWGKPGYATLDSLVGSYTGNEKLSGWGTWIKDGVKAKFSLARWRMPLLCAANSRVYTKMNQLAVTAP